MKQIALFACVPAFVLFSTSAATAQQSTAKMEQEGRQVRMVTQLGLSNSVHSLAFSPDNRTLAVGLSDGSIRIWNLRAGREVRKLQHGDYSGRIVFVDDFHLLSTGNDGIVRLWDLKTGTVLKTGSHDKPVRGLAVSKDGSIALTASNDNTVKVWKLPEMTQTAIFDHKAMAIDVAVSPDGKLAVSGDFAHRLAVWDTAKGQEIKSFYTDGPIYTVGFSPNGRFVASGSLLGTATVWELATGAKMSELRGKDSINSTVFSPDGGTLLVARLGKSPVGLYNIFSGSEIRSFPAEGVVMCGVRSPDGTLIAIGQQTNLTIWETAPGGSKTTIPVDETTIYDLGLSPDGRLLVVHSTLGPNADSTRLWNVSNPRLVYFQKRTGKGYHKVAFSNDGAMYASGSDDKLTLFFDTKTGKQIKAIPGPGAYVDVLRLSPDGKSFWVESPDSINLELRDFDTGKVIKTTNAPKGSVKYVKALSQDAKMALSQTDLKTNNNPGVIWSTENGNVLAPRLEAHRLPFEAAFSPDGFIVLTGDQWGNSYLWDAKTGRRMFTLETTTEQENIWALAFSPDGRLAATGGTKMKIDIWDSGTGKKYKTFKGHFSSVNSMAFSPDGKHLYSTGGDKTVRIWRVDNGQSVVMASQGDRWVIFTPDGYFDASQDAGDLVGAVIGDESFGIDQFAMKFNRPDVILKRMGLGTPEEISYYEGQYKRRLARMGYTEEQLKGDFHVPKAAIVSAKTTGDKAELKIKFSDDQYNLKSYNIYVNDVPIHAPPGVPLTGKEAEAKEDVELASGTNKIEVSCFNEAGAESFRVMTRAESKKPVTGNLYYLAFGVSRYKDKALNLKYADKDAKDLDAFVQGMKGTTAGRFGEVFTKILTNEEVTSDNIKSSKAFLEQSGVNDTVILFIAGHGVHDTGESPKYYYLTHNAAVNDLAGTAAPFELIEDLLQGLKARKKVFLMDTCESGELDNAASAGYFAMAKSRGIKPRAVRGLKKTAGGAQSTARPYLLERDRFLFNDLFRRSGAVVFSSSRGGEFSYESDTIKNGFFTRSIINTLSSGAADPGEGVLTTDQLQEKVSREVSENTGGAQNPTVDRDNIHQTITLPVIPSQVKAKTGKQ